MKDASRISYKKVEYKYRTKKKMTTKNSKLICVAWLENAKKASKLRGAWERTTARLFKQLELA